VQPSTRIFTKKTRPELARLEVRKTKEAHLIGQRTGAFRTPQVLGGDEIQGVMNFEEIPGLVPLKDLIGQEWPGLNPFLHQAGRALAVAHEELRLPRDFNVPMEREWMDASGKNVFVHGDFAGTNLCRSSVTGELVIIDWSLAPYFQSPGTYGSRWYDIVWFIVYLHQGVARGGVGRWKPHELATWFLAGYEARYPFLHEDLDSGNRLLRRQYRRMAWHYCRARRDRHGSLAAARHGVFQSYLWMKFGRHLLARGLGSLMQIREDHPSSPVA